MSERLEATAERFDEIAMQLEQSLAHARIAAEHFRAGDVPRGTAHAWAARGHLLEASDRLDAQAREHAHHSVPEG